MSVVIVRPGEPIPGDAGLVLIPGSKATIADLAFLRAQGWDIDIVAHRRRGGAVLGLCGGYQMLGRTHRRSGRHRRADRARSAGLGLLDVETVMGGDKITVPVAGRHVASGEPVTGYEIHLGRTSGPDCARPFLDLDGRPDGAQSADGRVIGHLCPRPLRERRLSPRLPRGPRRGGVGPPLRARGRGGARCARRASRTARRHRPAARDRRRHANAMTSPPRMAARRKRSAQAAR